MQVWLQLVATAVASDLLQLVVLAVGAVVISCKTAIDVNTAD